jgi:arginine repressor
MARTKGVNKTPAVQAYLSKNPTASAQQVVDALKAEGMEVSTSLVFNVKAAAKKNKAAKKAAKQAPKKAAALTNGTSGTKADAIREVAKGMGKRVRPMEVRAALSAKGIEVSYTQVSQVLTKMGMHKRRRRKSATGTAAPAARSTSTSLSIDDLVAAKKLVGQIGSIEKVKEALAALARLG